MKKIILIMALFASCKQQCPPANCSDYFNRFENMYMDQVHISNTLQDTINLKNDTIKMFKRGVFTKATNKGVNITTIGQKGGQTAAIINNK